jgi:hypothetical protein
LPVRAMVQFINNNDNFCNREIFGSKIRFGRIQFFVELELSRYGIMTSFIILVIYIHICIHLLFVFWQLEL